MRIIQGIIILIVALLLGSCGEDTDRLAQREIRDILYDISTDFNMKDFIGISDHLLQESYLHKGKIFHHFNSDWQSYMARFSLLEIDVLYIEVQDNKAVAHTTNTFTSPSETLVLNEPADNGDISYFYRYNGVWYVYGNQAWLKKGIKRNYDIN